VSDASESIIADFVGSFNSEVMTRAEPVDGRVLLSRKRLVLVVGPDDKLTIPLSNIFDLAVGHIPPDLGDFFESTVTVAFDRNGNRRVAAVEAEDEKITKFSNVLFKAILNGTQTNIKKRARVGGRVMDEEFSSAKLFLTPGNVEFRQNDGSFNVDIKTITDFERTAREISGSKRPTLTFRHMKKGEAITTMAAMPSPRKMSLLGRYLRLEYSELMEELQDVELTEDKKEILVAMYSTGDMGGMPLANIVSAESSQVTMLLQELAEDGLVQDAEDGPTLTATGEVVASRNLEDVNA
jgi:helix-turn-helix protein